MDTAGNLYQILGVAENAGEDELKAAYRRLAKKYHPDSHPGDKECEQRFQEISAAYNVLSNPDKRRKYDLNRGGRQAEGQKEESSQKAENRGNVQSQTVDFEHIHKSFEQFFGFNPNTGKITNEEKLKRKTDNPIDTTDLFERFMGIKR